MSKGLPKSRARRRRHHDVDRGRDADREGSAMKTLRQMRNDLVLTQEQVAEEVGLSRDHYNRIERGHHMPRQPIIHKLAEFFGVGVVGLRDHLLEEAREKNNA
jgi:transcriptional regulator with XRE-family HTH domain